MPDPGNSLTIEKMLMELNNSYKGIDLRVVLARSREESESDAWVSVFLKMVFTNKDRVNVRHLHEEIQRRVGVQDEKNLKVKLIYLKISQAHNIINCIRKGRVSISGYRATIKGGYNQLKSMEVIDSSFASPQYFCKMICSSMDSGSVVPYLEKMVGKQKVDIKRISELLDIGIFIVS